MSLFLLVAETELDWLKAFLGMKLISQGTWGETMKGISNEVLKTRQWYSYEVKEPAEDRITMIAEAVAEQLRDQSEAVMDLEAKLLTVPELQAVAAGLRLGVGLVAVFRSLASPPPPLADQLDQAIISAIRELGGMASTGQLVSRFRLTRVEMRKRLQLLVAFGRLVGTGAKGSRRYRLPVDGGADEAS
jgi:hypothetical protein